MALKVGTEDKKKVYMAAGLGAVMLILARSASRKRGGNP